MRTLVNAMGYLLVGSAILALGLWGKNYYHIQLFIFIGINTLLAVGLNMLMGYAGQISLGHAAFYGLGAYTTGVLGVHLGWPPVATLPCALLVSGLVAWLVGRPTLKLHGYYLGMGTLGVGMILHVLFREWASLTGGPSGLPSIPPLSLGPWVFPGGRAYLFIVWGVVLASFAVCHRLVHSRVGRALRAIHFSERAAAAVGVDTARAKLQIFVFAGVLAGLAGFLYAHMVTFVSPSSFDFLVSVRIVAMVVIGGMASIWGALFGAALLTLLPEWLHVFSDYEILVYGLILMVVMIFFPQGLTRGMLDLYERARRKSGSTP